MKSRGRIKQIGASIFLASVILSLALTSSHATLNEGSVSDTRQAPVDTPDIELVYYFPYAAKSWWGVWDRMWFRPHTWSENGIYYATLQDVEGGFLILGRSWQTPDNIYWVSCDGWGFNYWWTGYEFIWLNGSGHPPYCLPYAAQEILSWPPAYATPPSTP